MKYWQMTYVCGEERYVREHGSLESAERDACCHVLEHGIGQLCAEDEADEVTDGVEKMLQSIQLGGYRKRLPSTATSFSRGIGTRPSTWRRRCF